MVTPDRPVRILALAAALAAVTLGLGCQPEPLVRGGGPDAGGSRGAGAGGTTGAGGTAGIGSGASGGIDGTICGAVDHSTQPIPPTS